MLRVIALLCLALSVLAVEQLPETPLQRSGGGIQTFNVGKRISGDKLIWAGKGVQQIDIAKAITMELPFPQDGQTNNAVISQISAKTTLDAGTTQFSIQSGGVGQKSVNLKIVSNLAHKVSYDIAIYGK